MQCAQELEARAKANPTLELYNIYCETPPADQVSDLLQKLQEDTDVDLTKYSPVCIASVFKKFLRELPDPVIPVQWYDQFLEASSVYS